MLFEKADGRGGPFRRRGAQEQHRAGEGVKQGLGLNWIPPGVLEHELWQSQSDLVAVGGAFWAPHPVIGGLRALGCFLSGGVGTL